jgi:uncharacterized membrane protein YjgN (DUF898 family)
VAAWALLVLVQKLGISGIVGLVYVVFLPELIIRAQRFNAVNSAYRGVRFHFGAGFQAPKRPRRLFSAGYRETSQFLILPVFLVPLTLGLLYPYYAFRKRQFFLGHSAYGTQPFSFDAGPAAFYGAYSMVALLFLLFVAGSIATLGIAALPLYILFAAYRDAAVGRLVWKHTGLGQLRFDCDWNTWGLFKLHFLNSLAIILTVGLLVPWAAIRTARYQLQGLSLRPAGQIGGFVAAAQEQVGAAGDEAAEFLGFELGL